MKGNVSRIVSEGKFMQQGYLPVDVVLHLWKRMGAGEYDEYVRIPAIDLHNDAALISYIGMILAGSDHFSDLEASYQGRYFVLTGYGYDFSILPDSRNIHLLGLAPVAKSTIYYPDAALVADQALPITGRLVADVRLHITMEDEVGTAAPLPAG